MAEKTQLAIYCLLRFSCSFGPYTLQAAADPNGTKLNPIFYVCGLYIYIYSAKCHRDVNFFLSAEYHIKDLHVTFPVSARKGLLVMCGVCIEWWCFVIGQLLGGAW